MSEYIPFEIQEEILKRLPVRPLIQFRSVSKPWKGLIDSPDFIVSYGVRHPHPDRFILRYKLSSHNPVDDRYITLVDNDDDNSFVQQDFVPTIPDLIKKFEPHSLKVVGSSHGLLCFKGYYGQMVVIWNPSIRKSVSIQVPYICVSPYEKLANVGVHTVIGFGVCPVTFDPTILKIECIHYERKMKYMPDVSVPWKVQVFTLSTGAWSILSTNLPRESVRIQKRSPQVVIDGFVYWVAFDMLDAEDDQSQSHYLIVSFDLTAKEFEEIHLTDSLTNPLCKIQSISKLRESLVVLACHGLVGEYHTEFVGDISGCSLWMMKEHGVNRSFTKLYNINIPNPIINQILGFRKTHEPIMETVISGSSQNAEVQIYNPNSEAVDNLGIHGDSYSFFMCSYMETLLLLDQLDGFIYSINN